MEVLLDRLKQKESTRRVLFLHGRSSHYYKNMTVANSGMPACEEQNVYLRVSDEGGGGLGRAGEGGNPFFGLCGLLALAVAQVELCCCPLQDDRDFRDKITPISVVMEFSLDLQRAADVTGLQPLIDPSAPSNLTKQVSVCPSIYVCLSIYPSVCLSVYLPAYLSM